MCFITHCASRSVRKWLPVLMQAKRSVPVCRGYM